jgi:hypothetical protein
MEDATLRALIRRGILQICITQAGDSPRPGQNEGDGLIRVRLDVAVFIDYLYFDE